MSKTPQSLTSADVLREFIPGYHEEYGVVHYAKGMADRIASDAAKIADLETRLAGAKRTVGEDVLAWCEKVAAVNARYEDAKVGDSDEELEDAEHSRYETFLAFQHWWESRTHVPPVVPVVTEAITDADGAPVLVYMVLDQHNTPVAHSQDKDDADFAASQLANDEQQLRVVACHLQHAASEVRG